MERFTLNVSSRWPRYRGLKGKGGCSLPAWTNSSFSCTTIICCHKNPDCSAFQHGLKTTGSPGVSQALRGRLRLWGHAAHCVKQLWVFSLCCVEAAIVGISRQYCVNWASRCAFKKYISATDSVPLKKSPHPTTSTWFMVFAYALR